MRVSFRRFGSHDECETHLSFLRAIHHSKYQFISAAEKNSLEYQFISSRDPGEISVMNRMTKDNDMMNVGKHSGFFRAMESVINQTAYTKPLIIRNISQTV